MDNFQDTPERRESNDTKNCRPDKMADHYRRYAEEHSCKSKQYPAFNANIVFRFDYKRME